jgi:hypothetical protein
MVLNWVFKIVTYKGANWCRMCPVVGFVNMVVDLRTFCPDAVLRV